MFGASQKLQAKIGALLKRVLIINPAGPNLKLLQDMVRMAGAQSIDTCPNDRKTLDTLRDFDPTCVFIEVNASDSTPIDTIKKLRRSLYNCRKAPIIVVSSEVTSVMLVGCRDAGAHELLKRPYTQGDFHKRLEAIVTRPRDWIEAVGYIGPDRRRFNSAEFKGPRKRKSDQLSGEAATLDQCLRILKSAVQALHLDPHQAVRSMREQAMRLYKTKRLKEDPQFAQFIANLVQALKTDQPERAPLEQTIDQLWKHVQGSAPDSNIKLAS